MTLFFWSLIVDIGQTEYFIGDTGLSWYDAKHYCNSFGSSLASIHSKDDYYRAITKCEEKYKSRNDENGCWIGLNHINNTEEIWIWDDGTTTDYGFYDNNGNKPSRILPWYWEAQGNEDCVELMYYMDDNWNDAMCNDLNYPLCNCNNQNIASCHSVSFQNISNDLQISCNGLDESCKYINIQIYNQNNNELNINGICILRTGYDICWYSSMNVLNINDLTINCIYSWNCGFSSFYISNIDDLSINCTASQTCQYSLFDISNINNFSLLCPSNGCDYSKFNVSNINDLEINCNGGFSSCSWLLFNISNINYLEINCVGNSHCEHLLFNVFNISNLEIQCIGDKTCDYSSFNIFINNPFTINISYNKCLPFSMGMLCDADKSKCDILCDDYHETITTELYTKTVHFITEMNQCMIGKGGDNICQSSFYSTTKYKNQYICINNSNCIIQCSFVKCNNFIINATMANTLRLICHQNTNCSFINIYVGDNTKAFILLNGFAENITIHGNNSENINVGDSMGDYIANDDFMNDTVSNIAVVTISFIFAVLCAMTIGGILLVIIYKMFDNICSKIKDEYISSRPSYFIFWYSWIADILIFCIMYWWVIKAAMVYTIKPYENYCKIIYPSEEYWSRCNNDNYCNYECNKVYGNNVYFYNDLDCHCNQIKDIWSLNMFIVWFVISGLHVIVELIRYFIFGSFRTCCYDQDCCLFCHEKDLIDHEKYLIRQYWIFAYYKLPNTNKKLIAFIMTHLWRYGIFIIFGSIYYYTSINDIVAVYRIYWFEYYGLLILLIIKILLQIYYSFGKPYGIEEIYGEMMEILTRESNTDIANIIISFLPFYYKMKTKQKQSYELVALEETFVDDTVYN